MSKKEISEVIRLQCAENIKKALEMSGLDRKQAAASIGISYGRFNNYVNGSRCMSEDIARDFAKLTNTNACDYMNPDEIEKMRTDENKTVLKNHRETVLFLQYLGYQIKAGSLAKLRNYSNDDGVIAPALMLTDRNLQKKAVAEYIRAKKDYEESQQDPEKKKNLEIALHASTRAMEPMFILEKELDNIESEISEAVRSIIDRHLMNHINQTDISDMLLVMDLYCSRFEGMSQGNINPDELKRLCEDMRKQINHFNECNQ